MERIIIILLVYIAIKVTFIEIKMSKINDLEKLDTILHILYEKTDNISKSLED